MMSKDMINGTAIGNDDMALRANAWACRNAFRSKYPEGKIAKKLIQLQDGIALVEARVYLDKNDPEEGYVSNAFGQLQFRGGDETDDKSIETAEMVAIGRALVDAGYGVQNDVGSPTNVLTDAVPKHTKTKPKVAAVTAVQTEEPTTAAVSDAVSEGDKNDSVASVPPAVETISAADSAVVAENAPAPVTAVSQEATRAPAVEAPPLVTPKYTEDDMLDTILERMTLEEAKAVVVPFQSMKGKTLAEISLEQPQTLLWIINSYGGSNNILKAGAKILVDAAAEKTA